MSTSLFEEAIADAKKIREVAEENAKKAILEAVTPRIKEFIESQILEQDDSNEEKDDKLLKGDKEVDEDQCTEDVDEEIVELDESAISALVDLVNEDDVTDDAKNVMAAAMNEAVSRLDASEQKQILNIAQKLNGAVKNTISTDKINEERNMSKEQYYEVDLQALREAVEQLNEEEHEGDDAPVDLDLSDLPSDDSPLLGDDADADQADDNMISKDEVERQIRELISDLDLDLDEDEDDEADEADEEQLDEVFEIDPKMLQQELKRVKQQIQEAKGKGLAHEKGGIGKDMEKDFGGKGKKNVGVAGSFGGGKQGKDVLSEMRRDLRNQRRENASLETKLTKYRSAVQTLREQLEELNLFNAKLLYVNKLLQNKNISESQKRSVVQALDEAQDLREAKVLYKSLTESFSQGSRSKSRSLNESAKLGSSSKATKSASSTRATGEVDRWARLAGLK